MKKLLSLTALSLMLSFGLVSCAVADADEKEEFYTEGNSVYVLMNVPYADFYSQEGISKGQMELDAVSSATTSKCVSTTNLAKNTFNDSAAYNSGDVSKISMLGVTVPVQLTEGAYNAILANKVSDETDLGTAKKYSFKDLSETPVSYKKLAYSKKGRYSFSELKGTEKNSESLSVIEYTSNSSYGDHQISLEGVLTAGTIKGEAYSLYGAILSTTDNMNYAMYVLNNIWLGARVTNVEMAWSVIGGKETKKAHGASTEKFYQYDMNGKTLKNVKLLTSNGIYNISCNVKLDSFSAEKPSASVDANDSTKVNVTIPASYTNPKVTVSYASGRTSVKIADNVEAVNGVVTCSEAIDLAAKGTYTVSISSDNFATVSVSIYGPLTDANRTSLYEAICKANAIVEADESNTTLKAHIDEAEELLAKADAKSNEATDLIAELTSMITPAWNKLNPSDTYFAGIAGATKTRAYKGLFNQTILKSECDSIWEKYIKQACEKSGQPATDEVVQGYASALKGSISQPLYGPEAREANQAGFNCEFHPEDSILTFSTENSKTSLTVKTDSETTYTYSYIGTYNIGSKDDWVEYNPQFAAYGSIYYHCAIYKANERTAGEYTYLVLIGDNPEETFHIEFRYGSDLPSLTKCVTGKYALWLAAGIPTNADSEMIENVIHLFVFENMGVEE